ncbi:uncharacterized protein LOC135942617 isoform X2 [Cloeon dipterum]|uniref:uncharacterized protein LOC135942617 isoform X2 n=1 Tax=Cloeon dipterum TaxID=197152 RepID=UPI00321F8001
MSTLVGRSGSLGEQCLADTTCDPVAQHMRAWRILQHELKIQRVKTWENHHVNPGRQNISSSKHANIPNPLRCFSRLSLQPTSVSRSPSSLRSLQVERKNARISFSAHNESHKKHGDFAKEVTFKPKILDTSATSKLIQSRNYQTPKKKTLPQSRTSSAVSTKSIEPGQRKAEHKNWSQSRPESSSSSSTGCDSAYEAGGSIEALSPHSRSSTPQQVTVRGAEPKLDTDVEESRIVGKEIENAIEELIERPGTPVNLIDRNESLEYILFEHDLMNEIASCGVLTNFSVREICRSFALTNGKLLEQCKVQEIVERVQKLVGVPDNASLDFSDFGLHGSFDTPSNATSE